MVDTDTLNPLYTLDAGGSFDPCLGERIATRLQAGRTVLWRAASSTLLILTVFDGDTVMVRINRWRELAGDGLPLLLSDGWEATSCGLWAPSGYRSTAPVLVTEHADLVAANAALPAHDAAFGRLLDSAEAVAPDWHEQVPTAHPPAPCPVPGCAAHAPGSGRGRRPVR